jgi:hypothetical protein
LYCEVIYCISLWLSTPIGANVGAAENPQQ